MGGRQGVCPSILAALAALVALVALLAIVAAGVASAAPSSARSITIHAPTGPILAGDGALIRGQLHGHPVDDQRVALFQRRANGSEGYVMIGETRTAPDGDYEFDRAERDVLTNRGWFVRDLETGVDSPTAEVRVAALVSLSANRSLATRETPIVFSGHVTPSHTGERVMLQQQVAGLDAWRTVKLVRLGRGSDYSISYKWSDLGPKDVRVLFSGDRRNTGAASTPVTVMVELAQQRYFTTHSSSPMMPFGQSATISGVLKAVGTMTPQPDVRLQLWGWNLDHLSVPVGETTTSSDGRYRFDPPEMPSYNTEYQVRTLLLPYRSTVVLFQGVSDVVSLTASLRTPAHGMRITFTGNVLPDEFFYPRGVIYLQRRGVDGYWHTVETSSVSGDQRFRFEWQSDYPGAFKFRAWLNSDGRNIGSASPPVSILVTRPR